MHRIHKFIETRCFSTLTLLAESLAFSCLFDKINNIINITLHKPANMIIVAKVKLMCFRYDSFKKIKIKPEILNLLNILM